MTTEVMPIQSAAPERDPLRPVLIAASLLPVEVVDARRARRVRRLVLWALVLLTLAIGGWYGLSRYQTSMANDELVAAEDDAARLTQQQREFADVVRTQSESQAISSQLTTLLADDVRWSTLLASLRTAAPQGVELTGVAARLAEADRAGGAAPENAAALGAPAAETIGTIDITGEAGTKPQIAAYVDALSAVPGVADPYLQSANKQDSRFSFTIQLEITKETLGGRYTPKRMTGTGGR